MVYRIFLGFILILFGQSFAKDNCKQNKIHLYFTYQQNNSEVIQFLDFPRSVSLHGPSFKLLAVKSNPTIAKEKKIAFSIIANGKNIQNGFLIPSNEFPEYFIQSAPLKSENGDSLILFFQDAISRNQINLVFKISGNFGSCVMKVNLKNPD